MPASRPEGLERAAHRRGCPEGAGPHDRPGRRGTEHAQGGVTLELVHPPALGVDRPHHSVEEGVEHAHDLEQAGAASASAVEPTRSTNSTLTSRCFRPRGSPPAANGLAGHLLADVLPPKPHAPFPLAQARCHVVEARLQETDLPVVVDGHFGDRGRRWRHGPIARRCINGDRLGHRSCRDEGESRPDTIPMAASTSHPGEHLPWFAGARPTGVTSTPTRGCRRTEGPEEHESAPDAEDASASGADRRGPGTRAAGTCAPPRGP